MEQKEEAFEKAMQQTYATIAMLQDRQVTAKKDGIPALRRLLPIAQGDTGQSGVVAKFLIGLFDGENYPFDLSELRRLDFDLFDDCVAVLRMDHQPETEVHCHFANGSEIWLDLIRRWYGLPDENTEDAAASKARLDDQQVGVSLDSL